MSLVYSKTGSGLLVASEGASDERAVARALKDHDPELRLVPQAGGWRVYRYAGPDRPAEFVLFWGDDEGPWDLSMRIVDEVKRHDRNSREVARSAEELNEDAAAARRKHEENETEALLDDHKPQMRGVWPCLPPKNFGKGAA